MVTPSAQHRKIAAGLLLKAPRSKQEEYPAALVADWLDRTADADPVDTLMDTQRVLVKRGERIAELAETMAAQIGDGILLANVRGGFLRIAEMARGSEEPKRDP